VADLTQPEKSPSPPTDAVTSDDAPPGKKYNCTAKEPPQTRESGSTPILSSLSVSYDAVWFLCASSSWTEAVRATLAGSAYTGGLLRENRIRTERRESM
jgi:hypothetical protein